MFIFAISELQREHLNDMQEKINRVKAGRTSDEDLPKLLAKLKQGSITRAQFETEVTGQEEIAYKNLQIKKIVNHYYLPVVLGDKQTGYIQHIVKEQSEIDFLNNLEKWTTTNDNGKWDAWMFSKIDESLDKIYIPYFNEASNSYSRFLPDFIFWMCKDNKYQIVFVDPKGAVHINAYHKINGYKGLFEQSGKPKSFSYKSNQQVSTKLLMFNLEQSSLPEYNRYWTNDIAAIFNSS